MITIEPPTRNKPWPALSQSGMSRFLNRTRRAVGIAGEVEVLLTGDPTLRRLNKDFRSKDRPTDVLSFPSPEEISSVHAGDLAISLETAARQASSYGHSLRDEVRILLLHGLLHLAGLDHETDNGEMAVREAVLRRELRLPDTLIRRTLHKEGKSAKSPAEKLSRQPKANSVTAKKQRQNRRPAKKLRAQ